MIQTRSAGPACPPACRKTPPGTRKMPEPLTVPTTIRIRSRRPRTRVSARFDKRRYDITAKPPRLALFTNDRVDVVDVFVPAFSSRRVHDKVDVTNGRFRRSPDPDVFVTR